MTRTTRKDPRSEELAINALVVIGVTAALWALIWVMSERSEDAPIKEIVPAAPRGEEKEEGR